MLSLSQSCNDLNHHGVAGSNLVEAIFYCLLFWGGGGVFHLFVCLFCSGLTAAG